MDQMNRIQDIYRPVAERVKDRDEVERRLSAEEAEGQAARCRDCGIPFCHGAGCPLGNLIPEFNAAVAAGNLERALDVIGRTASSPSSRGASAPRCANPPARATSTTTR